MALSSDLPPTQIATCYHSRTLSAMGGRTMVTLAVGEEFPSASLQDIDGQTVDFPTIFSTAPATVVFFYRGRW